MSSELIKVFNYPIPEVLKELHKASQFSVFVDLDVRNAFHNIKLHPETSAILSVQTPFGQFEPIFLPEGVAPASEVFSEFSEWMIVIWDNMLVCAEDCADAFQKLVKVIRKCKERNVFLKLSKSSFGITRVEFFGYACERGSYCLSDARKGAVSAIPFPAGGNKIRKMQQFLGSAVYFKPFIYKYSEKAAVLSSMTHKDFNWLQSTWSCDCVALFDAFKLDIINAYTLYHPDYS